MKVSPQLSRAAASDSTASATGWSHGRAARAAIGGMGRISGRATTRECQTTRLSGRVIACASFAPVSRHFGTSGFRVRLTWLRLPLWSLQVHGVVFATGCAIELEERGDGFQSYLGFTVVTSRSATGHMS